MSGCKDCGVTLGRENKSGYCKKHVSGAIARDPVWREKQRKACRDAIHRDPERLQRLRKQALDIGRLPQAIEARRKHCVQSELWKRGNASQPKGSPARMKAGARGSATKLAWCPPKLRDEYRFLTESKRVPCEEARKMIEDQNELEMARWRRSVGIEVEPSKIEFVDPDYTPLERAIELVARRFGITVGKLFMSGRSTTPVLRARCALSVAMKREGHSLNEIARAVHKTDHSTSIHWVQKGEALLASDLKFRGIVDELVACWHPMGVAA